MAALLDWATILKNPAFSEEREWRILYKPIVSWEDGKHKVIGKLDRMHFFVRGNRIKKFFVLPFTDQKSFCPLNEIVIGPKNATSEETLRDFLAMQGLEKCKITVSKLSYR
jgi:hypothetical protein